MIDHFTSMGWTLYFHPDALTIIAKDGYGIAFHSIYDAYAWWTA